MDSSNATGDAESFRWSHLANLSDAKGIAGCFASVGNNSAGSDLLIVAGGVNFPDQPPWQGGDKVWRDPVWAMAYPTAAWQPAGRLPRPLGYGISAGCAGELWCVGGVDRQAHLASSFALQWNPIMNQVQVSDNALPPLPQPVAFGADLLGGSRLYAAGGWLVLGTAANGLITGAVGWSVCVLVTIAASLLFPVALVQPTYHNPMFP